MFPLNYIPFLISICKSLIIILMPQVDALWVEFEFQTCTSKFLSQSGQFLFFFHLVTLLTNVKLITNFNIPLLFWPLHTNLSFILLVLSLLLHCLVVDVAALQFVGPSTLVLSLTSNNFWLKFFSYYFQFSAHHNSRAYIHPLIYYPLFQWRFGEPFY